MARGRGTLMVGFFEPIPVYARLVIASSPLDCVCSLAPFPPTFLLGLEAQELEGEFQLLLREQQYVHLTLLFAALSRLAAIRRGRALGHEAYAPVARHCGTDAAYFRL